MDLFSKEKYRILKITNPNGAILYYPQYLSEFGKWKQIKNSMNRDTKVYFTDPDECEKWLSTYTGGYSIVEVGF